MASTAAIPLSAFAFAPTWYRSGRLLRKSRPISNLRRTVSARLPASVASVCDPRTGARIYLVGCVHGSQVSADDVTQLLERTVPDAVIVELCESRLASVKALMQQDQNESKKRPRNRRTFAKASEAFGGAGPAIVAFALETVYRLQTMSGVRPGIEFHPAIDGNSPWRVICGDAPARDTVQRLYTVFMSPVRSVRGSLSSVGDLLARVAFPPKGGVNIARLFLSEPPRLRELLRALLPAILISTAMSLTGTAGAAVLEATPAMSRLSAGYTPGVVQLLGISVAQSVAVGYIIVSTLQFLKVLIVDRDKILAQSALDAAAELGDRGATPPTVCVVVGLLHVNGILRHIQQQGAGKS